MVRIILESLEQGSEEEEEDAVVCSVRYPRDSSTGCKADGESNTDL
jgi:hypothetical protein